MEKDPFYISRLITAFLKGEATPEETETLRRLLEDDPSKKRLLERYENTSFISEEMDYISRLNKSMAWKAVQRKKYGQKNRRSIMQFSRVAGYAAAILVMCLVVWWQLLPRNSDERIVEDVTYGYKNDVLPGKAQAELVLSDGRTIALGDDSLRFSESDGSLLSSKDGVLQYATRSLPAGFGSAQLSNTIRVPAAGTYRVVLPDRTVVWLNAQSELTYPVRFAGNKRDVRLVGEAYFEVAHIAESVFTVRTAQGDVQVLGTHFNVDAYQSQRTLTTLVSGKVNIHHGETDRVIRPGQQAITDLAGNTSVREAAIDKATAWRDGYFYFSDDPITSIMDQLGRWYGVEVTYEGNMPSLPYGGSIGRDVTLGKALDMLKKVSGLGFQIDGKTVTVKNTND